MRFRAFFCFLAFGLLAMPAKPLANTSDPYAAVLTILYPGVEIQRENTQNWMPLAVGAVAPFGNGDRLRTDSTGRALVTFWDDTSTLILPGSSYRLDRLDILDGTGTILHGSLSGIAIHHIETMMAPSSYRLDMKTMVITQAAGQFATWAVPDQPYGVTVAEGRVELTLDGRSLALESGQGSYGANQVLAFDPPWNIARMQGLLEGCPGVVDTIGDVALRVRIGPGLGYVTMGAFDEAQTVQIMGVNESESWYRIQFLSGFGWILKLAVQTNCDTLPVLPDTSIESPTYILNTTADEMSLLEPFWGTPTSNEWFYQWVD